MQLFVYDNGNSSHKRKFKLYLFLIKFSLELLCLIYKNMYYNTFYYMIKIIITFYIYYTMP